MPDRVEGQSVESALLDYLTRREANEAAVEARWERYFELAQQQIEEQKAQNEGNLYTQIGMQKAGKAAENALWYMQEWQKTVNSREEALAQGIPPPSGSNAGLFVSDNNEDQWNIIGDIFNTPAPPSVDDALREAENAEQVATNATRPR